MPIIWLSVANELPKAVQAIPEHGPFSFITKHPDFESPIETTISASGDEVESNGQLSISSGLASALERSVDGADVADEIYDEYLRAFRSLTTKSLSVLKLLRQETHDFDLLGAHGFAGNPPGARWSTDGSKWIPATIDRYSAVVSVRRVGRLSRHSRSRVQRLLDTGEEPLLAYDHLAEAHRSVGLRFKWVEATVAAELAIKEILIRIEPKLATLLLEVPSPPLRTLYGKVLEAATGIRSPYVGQLHRGAERRNSIIHKTEPEDPDYQKTVDYIEMVTRAIDHLLEISRAAR
jgi:hypothetical protein